jgi:site-specific DNA-adenine methylase
MKFEHFLRKYYAQISYDLEDVIDIYEHYQNYRDKLNNKTKAMITEEKLFALGFTHFNGLYTKNGYSIRAKENKWLRSHENELLDYEIQSIIHLFSDYKVITGNNINF